MGREAARGADMLILTGGCVKWQRGSDSERSASVLLTWPGRSYAQIGTASLLIMLGDRIYPGSSRAQQGSCIRSDMPRVGYATLSELVAKQRQ